MKKIIKRFYQSIFSAILYYLKTFYDPKFYRDIAYRTEGFKLKPLLFFSFLLIIPSSLSLYQSMVNKFQTSWSEPLSTLPVLNLENYKLYHRNQNPLVASQIDPHYFSWLPENKTPADGLTENMHTMFLLGTDNIWVNMSDMNYFGFIIFNRTQYLPLMNWLLVKPPVFGKVILESLQHNMIWFVYFCAIFVAMTNAMFLILFIRTFGYIASKMVLMVLHDTLDYKTACRMLSTSAIPSLTILNILYYVIGTPVYFKFLTITVYMFYFYLSIRFIKARSEFRWLDQLYR